MTGDPFILTLALVGVVIIIAALQFSLGSKIPSRFDTLAAGIWPRLV